MSKTAPFIELAYSFNYDNPFPNDTNKEKLNTLRKIIRKTLPIDFTAIDTEIKFYDLDENITEIYMDDTKTKKLNELYMLDDIKNVISFIPQFNYYNNWLNQFNTVDAMQQPGINAMVGGNCDNADAMVGGNGDDADAMVGGNGDDADAADFVNGNVANGVNVGGNGDAMYENYDNVIPIQPSKFDYSATNGLTNYDIASEKPLPYDEIRKLTVNLARSKLRVAVEKSEQVLQLEKEKRKELMQNIQKYRNINAIGVLTEDNICDMNLDQLEHTLQHCEKLFQTQKLKEVIKRGTNFASLISSTVFPNGIKVGNKRIKAKGTGKVIIESIFDTQSTVGVAFQNIINKHHWNITDEAVLMLSIGEMFINSIKVEPANANSNTANSNSNSNTANSNSNSNTANSNTANSNTANSNDDAEESYYEEEEYDESTAN